MDQSAFQPRLDRRLMSPDAPQHFVSRTQLPATLRVFEKLRKARGEGIARETFCQRADFHMSNGPEQQARDELMQSMLGGDVKSPFPSRWTCPDVQAWLYGYDAVKEVEQALTSPSP
jgi:salicylate hydroxylase